MSILVAGFVRVRLDSKHLPHRVMLATPPLKHTAASACVSPSCSLIVNTFLRKSGDITSWRASVLEVVDIAREYWVKMSKSGNRYEAQIINNIDFEPCWYKLPMGDFVLEAFGDHVITAENLSTPLPAYQQTVRYSRNVREDF
jgi:hypothetical protein